MSGNTSATGGYLQPTSQPPIDGDALDQLMQQFVVGLTGMEPTMVRPRWQPTPPTQPPQNTDWCSVGIVSRKTYGFPYMQQDPPGTPSPGASVMTQQGEFELEVSFYGPNCDSLSAILRDGCFIPQNNETIGDFFIRIIGPGEVRRVPELINNIWTDRCDITIRFARAIQRTYPIEDIVSAGGTLTTTTGATSSFNAPPDGREPV